MPGRRRPARPAFLALLVLDPEVLRRDVLEATLGGPEAPLLAVTDHRDRPVYGRAGASAPRSWRRCRSARRCRPGGSRSTSRPALSPRAAIDRQVMLFTGAFGLLLVVIAAGLAATYRLVRRETEMARLKAEFVANVSHDLKTPLSLIRMFGETLEMGRVTDEATRHEYYRVITRESERLSRLIENVLDFSRIEGGRRTLRPRAGERGAARPRHRRELRLRAGPAGVQGRRGDPARPARGADGRRRRRPGAREPDRQRDQVLRGAEGPDGGGRASRTAGSRSRSATRGSASRARSRGRSSTSSTGSGGARRRAGGAAGSGSPSCATSPRPTGAASRVDSRPGEGSRFTLWLPLSRPAG